VIRRAGEGLRTTGTVVGGAVANHPVPLALIGAGLAWLLLEGRIRRLSSDAFALLEDAHLMDRAGRTIGDVSQRVVGAAGSVRDAIASGAETFGETVSGLGESVRDGASVVSESASEVYRKGRASAADAWEHHPLAVSAAILATGLAVGMLLPSTMSENGVVGRQSDALKRRVRQAGSALAERGKKVATAIGNAASLEAVGEGLGASEVVRKVGKIAERVKDATVSVARGEMLGATSGTGTKGTRANGRKRGSR